MTTLGTMMLRNRGTCSHRVGHHHLSQIRRLAPPSSSANFPHEFLEGGSHPISSSVTSCGSQSRDVKSQWWNQSTTVMQDEATRSTKQASTRSASFSTSATTCGSTLEMAPKTNNIATFSTLAAAAVQCEEDDGAPAAPTASKKKKKTKKSLRSLARKTANVVDEDILALASLKPTPLSLSNMYRYACPDTTQPGQRLRNAQFLHKELQIRIAQRITDLYRLPHGLNQTAPVRDVVKTYVDYLRGFQAIPAPRTDEEEEAFTEFLRGLVLDRTSIPRAIHDGLGSLRDNRRAPLPGRQLDDLEIALSRFFTARVGLRFITEHHILSSPSPRIDVDAFRRQQNYLDDETLDDEDDENGHSDKLFLGAIQAKCDPVREARRVARQVERHCRRSYGSAPEIEVIDACGDDEGREFTYVPHHLHYMLAELLKNSCRAVIRRRERAADNARAAALSSLSRQMLEREGSVGSSDSTLPPIKVVVVKGEEDVTIKVADRGGGVPRSAVDRIWTFAHSTIIGEDRKRKKRRQMNTGSLVDGGGSGGVEDDEETEEFAQDAFTKSSYVRGFGLPLARIYARYFGGELTLKSMEGYGVDAYLYLPVLGDACENLPERVYRSPGNLDSNVHEDGEEEAEAHEVEESQEDEEFLSVAHSGGWGSTTWLDSMYSKRDMALEKLAQKAL